MDFKIDSTLNTAKASVVLYLGKIIRTTNASLILYTYLCIYKYNYYL